MMRRIFYILPFLFSLLSAQDMELTPIFQPTPQYGTVLNGAPYWLKSNPSLMDLNGVENLTNTTFDAGTTGWASSGGVLTQNTHLDRVHSGTGSAQLVNPSANGASEMRLSPVFADVSTNKFTLEAWVYCPSTDSTRKAQLNFCNQSNGVIGTGALTTLTANTWTKLVMNLSAPGTQTGLMFVARLFNAGVNDTLYVDDVSLTQAYDALFHVVDRIDAINGAVFSNRTTTGSGANVGYSFSPAATTTCTFRMADGVNNGTAVVSPSFTAGMFHSFDITVARDGNATVYVDGVAGTPVSETSVGKIVTGQNFVIGSISAGTSLWHTGAVGEMQMVRFTSLPSDIATTTSAMSSRKKPFASYTNQTTGGIWIDWTSPNDKWGLNNLTPIGGAHTQRVQY